MAHNKALPKIHTQSGIRQSDSLTLLRWPRDRQLSGRAVVPQGAGQGLGLPSTRRRQ